jgi:N-dimethylarginine dimethylaminohydrolase
MVKNKTYGCQSMIEPLQGVILKRPEDAFTGQGHLEAHWRDFNYGGCPDYQAVLREFREFERIIEDHVPRVYYLPKDDRVGLDSIYTHDAVKITSRGAVLMNMGKEPRKNEPQVMKEFLEEQGMPVLGEITGGGRMEGGDVVWLDGQTLAVGSGYRTNREGIDQLKKLTGDFVKEIIEVPLPHAEGVDECLHLMSIISLVDWDLAVVYSRYMPVFFRQMLLERGLRLIEVDDGEYDRLASNVLALSPGKCLVLSGNPSIKNQLENAGVEVLEYPGKELSLKGTGGPTCLTCPVWRTMQKRAQGRT